MIHNACSAAALIDAAEADCLGVFAHFDRVERENTRRVLAAFRRAGISARHFYPSTGYGYGDIGRDALSDLFAELMGSEAALARPQIASGTHALALCLFGILRPGDMFFSAAGKPYDTMESVIGLNGSSGMGSLREFGVEYRQADLIDGKPDIIRIAELAAGARLALIQRSRGYNWRPSIMLGEMKAAIEAIKKVNPDAIVMVDNCYGEFTDIMEPGGAGADIIAGSLIKNPGGGLAPTGGYIAGRADLIEKVSYRLTTPGVGGEIGACPGGYLPFYQGLFMAPHVTAQALKTAALAARAFEKLGFEVSPPYDGARSDIIQAIRFPGPEALIAFVRSIQAMSPVDSQAVPEPWGMPGYRDPVIMAAGTFIAGSSIELSADAPIRPPYAAYLQGALTYAHGRLAIEEAVKCLHKMGHA